MSVFNRAEAVDEKFRSFLDELSSPDGSTPPVKQPVHPDTDLTWARVRQQFESQLASRQLDLVARDMKRNGTGYYTISSAGHEGNAAIAAVLRHDDPAIVHYRSGAFMIHRVFRHLGSRPLRDLVLSLAASSEDPVAGGRHKVFGDADTFVPPQTSTIASHLPRAVGMAFSIGQAKRLNRTLPVPDEAIMACSFGDASVNHSVFQGAINSMLWAVHRDLPLPALLICEDNGWGISVPTPEGWIEESMKQRHGLTYMQCDGRDLLDTYETTKEAVELIRSRRQPVFLHMKTVRLMGHSGEDVELEYRSREEVEATEDQDPLKRTAEWLVQNDVMAPGEILDRYESFGEELQTYADEAAEAPKLSSPEEVMEPLAPVSPDEVSQEARRMDYREERMDLFGGEEELPEHHEKEEPMARLLNRGLADLLAKYREMVLFGEDVARKGGVYYVTRDLQELTGPDRVFDTMLDETTILGLGLGLSIFDLLPVPEIQYLAYVYNAYDQLRGEAGSQSFFSDGKFTNGMVVRVQSFAYQKGFGGHFHNDNGIAALREIPGVVIAVPSRGDDAVEMLRTALALARVDGRLVLFLEPIALYHERDLYEDGDERWQQTFPSPGTAIPPGEPRVYRDDRDTDLTILTFGNGVRMSLRAARTLSREDEVECRVLDLRWLAPLNRSVLRKEAQRNERLLVVDECRRAGGPSAEIMTCLRREGDRDMRLKRVTSEDSYVPLGPASKEVLMTEEDIREGVRSLLQ